MSRHAWAPKSTRSELQRWLSPVLVMLFPALAHAHVGVGPASGLLSGFSHPVTGLDHLVAMVAVGIWAAQCGGRAMRLVPLVFVGVTTIGGALGMAAIAIPFVEPGIVASVLVLGLLIATALRMPLAASAMLVAVFAIFHGHAHGSEMPATAAGLVYAAGFIAANVCLQFLGVGIGLGVKRWGSEQLVRFAGSAVVACGFYLCFV